MQRILRSLEADWWRLVWPVTVFVLCLAAGILVRRLVLNALRRNSRVGPLIADALRGPILIWALIGGVDLATRSSELPARYVHRVDVGLLALWIVSLTMIAAQVAGNLVRFYGSHVSASESGQQAAASATLSRNLAQIAVYTLGILILLNHIGVDIRPLLTALGVGGLAVALALQDTMANLFAGFYISVAGQIRLGDYVKLNTGEEGYVVDITWRSTTLRALANNLIFVPNSKLGQANVTNYSLPDKKMGSNITVRVPFGTDADRLQTLLLEEAKGVVGLVDDAGVNVSWIPGFSDTALVLSLNYTVTEFVSQYGVQSELRRRIYLRLQREGISLGAPTQIIVTASSPGSSSPLPR